MPDTAPPPVDDLEQPVAPEAPSGGRATQLASSISSTGFGVDPDAPEAGGSWWRLAVLLGVLVLIGVSNPWMLVVILALVVMITLHELGHYLMAKRAGMKVTEFFLGFGPKIWSTRRGETEYGIKVIPAGAYVKIPGMVNLDEVDPADEARTYRQKPFWDRIGVAVAGSAMHFMLALVLIFIALVIVGQPGGTLNPTGSDVPPIVNEVVPGSGADDAGLRSGDQVLSVAGTETPTSESLRAAVAPVRGETADVVILRDGERLTEEVDIRAFSSEGTRTCGLGIDMRPPAEERLNPVEGLVAAPKEFANIMWLSMQGLGRFFSPSGISDFADQVGSAQNDRAAIEQTERTREEDPCAIKTVAGPVGGSSGSSSSGENRILSIVGVVRIGSDVGGVDPAGLIALFALINIFIGVFNLIPLLPFDGGHVAIACYERVQERRLHRRRYFADVSRLLPVTYAIVALLGLLFLSSLYVDIVNPIGG